MNRKLVDIIIVNWNSGIQLLECLKSIELSKKKRGILKTYSGS